MDSLFRIDWFSGFCLGILTTVATAADRERYAEEIQPLLQRYCFDCHWDGEDPEGGVNLERFASAEQVLREREIWRYVFDKVESRQMPPPLDADLPSDAERQQILDWIAAIAAEPDPVLGARDPGKPILRRLTRLEYNNTVRDLLQLDTDVFMFAERVPLADKNYFQPASGKLQGPLRVRMREYGAKYPVLLPASGLPGDNRAEHGYRNRGDAMNLSPLLLEKYVALAGEIVNHPELPRRSGVFAELLGIDVAALPEPTRPAPSGTNPQNPVAAVERFAPNAESLAVAAELTSEDLQQFRRAVTDAFDEGRGGVFDVPESLKNQTIAGKGGLIKTSFGNGKLLTINPDADLWLVSFGTAEETSGTYLIANKNRGAKEYELTLHVRDGDEGEGIVRLGVCVLGRRNEHGEVTLTATFTDGTTQSRSAAIAEGPAGTTFFEFRSVPGESIRRLKIDGSQFSGDYVLIDDIGFITDGEASVVVGRPAPASTQGEPSVVDRASAKQPPSAKQPALPPRERLTQFIERAFRRPVRQDEIDRYFALYQSAQQGGKTQEDAMRLAAQAVLSSPGFLFIAEADTETTPSDVPGISGGSVRALNDYELANRLSYFLWSSLPDDELFALAKTGQLRDEKTLQAQVLRMLRDPKARELSESFAIQWLRLDQLYTAQPDRQLFREFYAGAQGKETAHASQLVEALLLFETVLIEDRSILEFIGADYTWLNPRLAKLYGVALDSGSAAEASGSTSVGNREVTSDGPSANNLWRRVSLRDTSRGGYLTMSGPLTVTSLPFRNSPVKRGAWLLETIFNRPPTEPKIAFAIENDTKQAAKMQSIREKFEAHRDKAACYSCHIRIDPPGFALERFDPIGAWREQDAGSPVDARSRWNGSDFDGPAEFKALLLKEPHEFTRGFIEHLLSYALGRELTIHDLPTVQQIQTSAQESDHRFGAIVQAIITSYPFRHTRLEPSLAD